MITNQPDAGRPDAPPPPPPPDYPDAAECAASVPIEITERPTPPDVLLVVDKSGSMRQQLDPASVRTKFEIIRAALRDVIEPHDNEVYFGLSLFPESGQCGAGNVVVNPAADQADAIMIRLNAVSNPDGATPTHTTLNNARSYYQSRPVNPNGRYVLLATDGEPNCGPGGSNDNTDAESISAVAALAAIGVKTYVIGFGGGSSVDPATLQSMAEAGLTAPYYQALNADQLAQALEDISSELIMPSCEYLLSTVPEDSDLISVDFDGADVPRTSSHTNGWDYDPATNVINLYGSYCDQVQSGAIMNVHVEWGCEGPTVD
jgi:hypothetical protein